MTKIMHAQVIGTMSGFMIGAGMAMSVGLRAIIVLCLIAFAISVVLLLSRTNG